MNRLVLLVLLGGVGACGSTQPFDGSDVDLIGTWGTEVTGFYKLASNPAVECSASWNMPFFSDPGYPPGAIGSEVPLEATQSCEDGTSGDFPYRGMGLVAYHRGDSVFLLTGSRADTFIIARLVSSTRMAGQMQQLYLGGGHVTATR
jgi:hypothetical protein